MTRRTSLPSHLRGAAFRTGETGFHEASAGRLRALDLQRPFHGVRSSGLDLDDLIDRCWAYEPLLRPGEAFSHETAARLYGLPLPSEGADLHVTAPTGLERARSEGVAGHELAGVIPIRLHLGLPVVVPALAWCQLATGLAVPDLVALGDAIVTGPRMRRTRKPALGTPADLQRLATWWGRRRGSRKLARALPLVRIGAESRPETHVRLLLLRSGLPEPLLNDATVLLDGQVLHPDLKYVAWRIVLEFQGDDHRTNRRVWQEDVRRKRAFERAGWRVVEVTSDDLYVDSTSLLARIRELIASA
ncbi:hypothetical protein [Agromyces bauzanensis]